MATGPPLYRSEFPTGYSLAGCSPAEPASASPDHCLYLFTRSWRNPAPSQSVSNFGVSPTGCSPQHINSMLQRFEKGHQIWLSTPALRRGAGTDLTLR